MRVTVTAKDERPGRGCGFRKIFRKVVDKFGGPLAVHCHYVADLTVPRDSAELTASNPLEIVFK